MPRWRDYYLGHDQTPHYEYGKSLHQILSWQDGKTKQWVMNAHSTSSSCDDHARLSDAILVFTHRDPVASLQSIVTQIAYAIRTREKSVDPDWYLEYWTDRVHGLLSAYVRDLDVVALRPAGARPFHEFVRDDIGWVERVYEAAGLPMTDRARGEIQHYLGDHQRGNTARSTTISSGTSASTLNEIRKRFDFYFETRPVAVEAGKP